MTRTTAFLLLATWPAAATAAEPPSAADAAWFEKQVRPLLADRCFACHAAAGKHRGGLALDSRDAVLQGGDSGPAVVPGDPAKSLLVQAVRQEKEGLQMPPKGKLPARDVAVLEEWVRRGAPFPGGGPAPPRADGVDLAAGRRFWSFLPLSPRPLPAVRDAAWPQTRVDFFVLAELEKRNLAPSGPADRRVLIRRAAFDLTGLPPTPAEVEAFVRDDRPDAYAQLVERLLASPRHGERWARFWLDLARYCDIGESWVTARGQPWLYRDWVAQALNADLPYDQFVRKQLAADLLPDGDRRDRAALGFLGLSPDYWKELMLDKELIKGVVADEWEERIDAVASTFLGLTVACARCHDHKFDPISTHDYYALAGVFASTRIVDLSLLPDDQAAQAREARDRARGLRDQIARLKAQKPPPANADRQLADLAAQVEQVEAGAPGYHAPEARGVADAALTVAADGPHRTRLDYQPGVGQDVAVHIRGNPSNLGPVVPRRFLAVLSSGEPRRFTQGSGRRELADAIVGDGGPLAARVIVNRVWKQHFGRGLVDTPSDFGSQGARPSHPDLLDDLAARFRANGWSLKWLHREILLSATYQQSSGPDAGKARIDPDNRWLWRMNRRRLEIEAWRDAMLAVAGALDQRQGGPPLDLTEPANLRRTLYGTVKRRDLPDMLRLHDFPDPVASSAGRTPTTTPLQQLFTLNSPLLRQQAVALAARLKRETPPGEARVRRAYELLFGRPATDRQVQRGLAFLGEPADDEAWAEYAHALLGSNEFLFID